mgnify:CR=1 FL=1
MTANFDELTDFYAKSYEWIFDNLKVILGLNNIFVRNDSTKCVNGKTYQDFIRESNGNKNEKWICRRKKNHLANLLVV